jgi:hypothetical protein
MKKGVELYSKNDLLEIKEDFEEITKAQRRILGVKKIRPTIVGWVLVAILLVAIPLLYATTIKDAMWYRAGAAIGNEQTSVLHTDTIFISNAEIKALQGTPVDLVAAPGSGYGLEFISAVLFLDYGSSQLTESSDDLVIQFGSGTDVSGTITASGFVTAAADTVAVTGAVDVVGTATSSIANDELELINSGNGDYGTGDSTMTVIITYRIHKTGL